MKSLSIVSFGFNGGKIAQIHEPNAFEAIKDLLNECHRFEAFNNEPDMEAPYSYIFTNHHERLCEILDACISDSFGTGRGGLPGNNDSGGLSSCFAWNLLGVFPVSGQNLILLGKPFADRADIKLSNNKKIEIIKHGDGATVKKVLFRGVEVFGYRITATGFMDGGVIEFFMG